MFDHLPGNRCSQSVHIKLFRGIVKYTLSELFKFNAYETLPRFTYKSRSNKEIL